LKTVAYKEGKVIGEAVVKTAGEPYSVRLTPDRSSIEATGNDLSYVLMEVYDKDGNLCPLADNLINIEIKGPGEIAGVGNGNPQSLDPFVSNQGRLFYGKAMLIVKSKENEAGKIDIEARSEGLKTSKVTVTSK
jgi:beta-galactosidase